MRFYSLLLLLSFSLTAQAEHHREHAIGFTNAADLHTRLTLKSITYYTNHPSCAFTNSQQASIDVIFLYSGRLRATLDVIRAELQDPMSDLDVIRRRVNQPKASNDNGGISATKRIQGIAIRARKLITACPEANGYLTGVFQRITLAWQAIDRIAWHVTDAIREEVYNDPEFQ